MAPGQHVSSTPNPTSDYDVIKTPNEANNQRRFGPSPWTAKLGYLGNVAQALIVLSVMVYVYGQIAYFAPHYSSLNKTFGYWWGAPRVPSAKAPKGHTEMNRPTYFFFFGILPLFVSLFLL
ncbi:hypothetical protein PybrP1_006455, partial [[Pythium] brassicae (nom. inval.)]